MFLPFGRIRDLGGVRKPVPSQQKLTLFLNSRWRGRFPHPHSSGRSDRHYLQLSPRRHTFPLSTMQKPSAQPDVLQQKVKISVFH